MTSRITEFEPPHRFVDEMVRGPFGAFRHEHRFDRQGDGTRMTDVVRFRMGWGVVGRLADPFAAVYLRLPPRPLPELVRPLPRSPARPTWSTTPGCCDVFRRFGCLR